MKHQEIVSKMTLEQKAAFVSGSDYWHLEEAPALGLPKINVTDGPHGLRKQNPNGDKKGLGNSFPATCFPPASLSGCAWDEALLEEQGKAMGEECLQEQVSVILGPGVNIKRSPTCGRNFEYFSEDPYHAGKCAAALIRGIQGQGVGASLKHFAVNSQEAYRMIINEVVDMRAFREIYLTAFEIAVKEGKPWTVMNSYNRINGTYASQSELLQQTICRGEWGFDGLFVTDWGSSVDRIPGLVNGTDLEMPSSGDVNTKKIIAAVKSGELDEAVLDERVGNVVELIEKSKPALSEKHTYDADAHHALASRVAEGAMQLLKNEDSILPLKAGQKVAVIGEMARTPRYQGAGSSVINCTKLSNALEELEKLGVDVTFAPGYPKADAKTDETLLGEAEAAAKNADVAVLFIGLTEELEAEGYDRVNIDLPESHNRLCERVTKANPNTVVVLSGGSVVLMPWLSHVKGLLNAGLGGQAGGVAVARLLTGKVNPSGKTTETYPLSYEDNPVYGNYPAGPVTSEHRESVYIGYRYYDAANKAVQFPFGFGLSYTAFEYSNLTLSKAEMSDSDTLTATLTVKNTGACDGAEVVELYVHDKESTVFRPVQELKAFCKVFLKAGEEKEISLSLDKRAFAFFNVRTNDWCVESGAFEIRVGASSRDIRLTAEVTVTALSPAALPDYRRDAPAYYTDVTKIDRKQFSAIFGEALPSPERDKNARIDLYCCLGDAAHTKHGGRLCRFVNKLMAKMAGSEENGDGKMLAAMALQIPIRNFMAMSMGVMSPKMAEGLLMYLNDGESAFLGILKLLGGIPKALTKLPHLLKSL